MKRPLRLGWWLFVLAMTMPGTPPLFAQSDDVVQLIESSSGVPYRCCYNFIVTNRHAASARISELRVRIIEGRARFITGTVQSPPDWSVFMSQDFKTLTWTAGATQSEIDSGETLTDFNVCANDTGVVRMVWETRNLGGVMSTDTLTAICRGVTCDEAFFTQIISNQTCGFDIDLGNGNIGELPITGFRLRMLTPGVSFAGVPTRVPEGWSRITQKADSISFIASNSLAAGDFVRGFRIGVDAARDVPFDIEWWTMSGSQILCRDTASIRCRPLPAIDTLRVTRPAGDSCCQHWTLRNTHQPTTPIEALTIKVLTPGVRISAAPGAPFDWTRVGPNAAGDSVAFVSGSGFLTSQSIDLAGLCFENTPASTDTVTYRWQTYHDGEIVTQGIGTQYCLRPLTRCDDLSATFESVTNRCIALTVRNRNSRTSTIDGLIVQIANDGTPRTILSATEPVGWRIERAEGTSAAFSGGTIAPNDSARFLFCVSPGDASTRDPLRIMWQTFAGQQQICTDTIAFNIVPAQRCDTVAIAETVTPTASHCCYTLAFFNRNESGRSVDRMQIEVADPRLRFEDVSGGGLWTVSPQSFPTTSAEFSGGSLAPGDSTIRFSFCIDASEISARPTTLPIIWRTLSGGEVICSDTMRVGCEGRVAVECDTFRLVEVTSDPPVCSYSFRVANLHTPASVVNDIRFRMIGPAGRFVGALGTGRASSWSAVTVRRDTVHFRGDSIVSLDTVGNFVVRVDSVLGGSVRLEACTMNNGIPICCALLDLTCVPSDVELPIEPTGFRMYEAEPNPFTLTTSIRYELLRSGTVSIVLRDETGRELRRFDRGAEATGEHRFLLEGNGLPSGVYYVTVEANGEMMTRRIVLVR